MFGQIVKRDVYSASFFYTAYMSSHFQMPFLVILPLNKTFDFTLCAGKMFGLYY